MPKKKFPKRFISIPKPRRGKNMFQCKCGAQFRTMAKLVKHQFKKHDPSK